jgi:hypothetical protein
VNDGGGIGVKDGGEGAVETGFHRRHNSLTDAQLLADAFEDQHVGVYCHADGQQDTGDARQRERGPKVRQKGHQDEKVHHQSHHCIHA